MKRRLLLSAVCLLLCGFGSCSRYIENKQAARAVEASKKAECQTLDDRAIGWEEERALGGAVGVHWVSDGGGLTTHPDQKALHLQLNKIGRNLAAQSSRPTLPWVFGVLQSEGVNAVSGPGGYVFVTEGLLARLDDEAQLAGVLAHEISHITRKHALNEYQRYLKDECVRAAESEGWSAEQALASEGLAYAGQHVGSAASAVLEKLSWGQWGEVLAQVTRSAVRSLNIDQVSDAIVRKLMKGFLDAMTDKGLSEADEYAADLDAVELMAAAGYSPDAYLTFLTKLPDKGLFTPHPSKKKRRERLASHLERLRQAERDNPTGFGSSVVLQHTAVIPLRDELRARQPGAAAR
ncbi:M48 family metallopeptidase [Melittangium boletus]|uniref:M48 family metallopeptidase n=1 Tax=Melittangium boletus TaxID=83453 RepID=UPI003DA31309